MATDERWEPDVGAMNAADDYDDLEQKMIARCLVNYAANTTAIQARAHYEPQLEALHDDVERLRGELRATQQIGWESLYTGTVKEQAARIVELEAELRHQADSITVLKGELERRAPFLTNGATTEAGDCDIVCSVCGVPTEVAHAASECFAMTAEAESMVEDAHVQMITELEAKCEALTKETWKLGTRGDEAIERADELSVQLKAQLSRGVFVRELSDEEVFALMGQETNPDGDYMPWVRRCIAAATKLPEGAVRWTSAVEVDEFCNSRTIDVTKAVISSDLPGGTKGTLHIVFVPEVTGA